MTSIPGPIQVNDVDFLPKVASVEALNASRVSCYCELPRTMFEVPSGFKHEIVTEFTTRHTVYDERPDLDRTLYCFRIIDAYLLPHFGIVITQDGKLLRIPGSEATLSMPLASLIGLNAEGRIEIPPDVVKLGPVALSIPWGAHINYGHFLLDALSSIYLLFANGFQRTHTFVAPKLNLWHRVHLASMDCVPTELEHRFWRVSEVIYTSCMDYFLHAPTGVYKKIVEKQFSGFLAPLNSGPRKRLYLARPEGGRKLMSDPEIRRRLVTEGFNVVETSKMPIEEQIQLFQDAELIVAPTGAGLANLIYCRSGTRVIEIVPPIMESLWTRHIAYFMGLNLVTYLCRTVRLNKDNPLSDHDYDLDVDRLMSTVLSLSQPLSSPTL